MSPRLARSQLSTNTYFHVCARGNNRQSIFLDDGDRLRYLALLEKYRSRFNLRCFAYCLMTNHVHLLLLVPSLKILSKAIHGLHVAYVMYFNQRYERKGHLFQDRFVSWVIENGGHLITAKEYVEENPVKANLAASKEDYRWSSASRDGPFVTIEKIMS